MLAFYGIPSWFLCSSFVSLILLFYLMHRPHLVTSIPPFPQWSQPGRHFRSSKPNRSSRCSSGKCGPATLLLLLFLLTPVVIDSSFLPRQHLLQTNCGTSAPDAELQGGVQTTFCRSGNGGRQHSWWVCVSVRKYRANMPLCRPSTFLHLICRRNQTNPWVRARGSSIQNAAERLEDWRHIW